MNRIENILIGFSLADALGVPVEFNSRRSLQKDPVINMRSYGTYNQPAGTWSDDSSLSFCLAESLCDGYDLKNIAQKFVAWTHSKIWTPHGDVFDIGIQTSSSIRKLATILDNEEYDTLSDLKNTGDERTNGNGSLMRIIPLLFFIKGKNIKNQFKSVWEVSALTHPHFRSALSCLIHLKFAEHISNGSSIEKAYSKMKTDINQFCIDEDFPKYEMNHFDRLLNNDIKKLTLDSINSSGYVIDTLEASFWCLLNSNSYVSSVLKAINLGHDTDTTACVVGGIAGMYYGLEEVPEIWINRITRIKDIKELASKFENSLIKEKQNERETNKNNQ